MNRLTNRNYKNITLELESCKPYLKLGQLEDLEEGLKIDFTIGGKAMLNGIYTKHYGFISGGLVCLEKFRIYIPIYSLHLPFTGPAGYGKTWALTKEELE